MSFIGGNRLRPHSEDASLKDRGILKLDSENFIVKDGNVYLKISDSALTSSLKSNDSQSHN